MTLAWRRTSRRRVFSAESAHTECGRGTGRLRGWWGLGAALLTSVVLALVGAPGCKKGSKAPEKGPEKPTLRVFALAGAAGAVEPCGCVKDMLGGVDHAAAFIDAAKKESPAALVVGAGPMLFADPTLPGDETTQANFKAEAMARSLEDVGLEAWAPGANDWALGAKRLGELVEQTGAALLAGNLKGETAGAKGSTMVEAGGHKVGLVGVSIPRFRGGSVNGVEIGDAAEALRQGRKAVAEAPIAIALIAASRGDALRLAEQVDGFQLVIVGKGYDQGEGNDTPFSPTVVNDTLVVQATNHLQGVSVVDLFVRGDSYQFADGSGLEQAEARTSLERRIGELERRIARWQEPNSGVKPAEIQRGKSDLDQLKKQLASLAAPEPPKEGSYFEYQLVEVRESLGAEKSVKARLEAYYKRVNEHNAKAFADRKPPEVSEGQSSYLGVDQCTNCHQEERKFWDGSRHSHAYETLVEGHKQFNLDCVSCHVTGYEKPGGSTVTHVDDLKDVQCEVCHGPGSRHAENPGDLTLIQRVPATSLCVSCHHPPHVGTDWDVSNAWPLILGPGHGKPANAP